VAARPNASAVQRIRVLHRNIGYFTAGLTILFALSGIVQTYRDTDLFQHEVQVERQIEPGLAPEALGPALRLREAKVLREEGNVVYFQGGWYDRGTGRAVRTESRFIFPLDRFSALHKAPSKSAVHWLTNLYAVLLLFMAVSSFWMFPGGSAQRRKGLLVAALGIAFAVALLFLAPGA
jgi:hypothetical protein